MSDQTKNKSPENYEIWKSSWRRIHQSFMLYTAPVLLAIELIMFIVMIVLDSLDISPLKYLIKYAIVLSCSVMLIAVCSSMLCRLKISERVKNYITALSFTLITLVIPYVHCYFPCAGVSIVLSIILASIYTERRLTLLTTAVGMIGLLLGTLVFRYDNGTVRDEPYMMNVIVIALILLIVALACTISAEWEKRLASTFSRAQDERTRYMELAMFDILTNVKNRLALRSEFDALLANRDTDFWFMIFDLDQFKSINDTYGHQEGDRILTEVGKVLRAMENDETSAFRYGGDEFCFLVRHASRQGLLELSEQLSERIGDISHPKAGEKITVSIGAASMAGQPSVSECIHDADSAMYLSKRSGGKIHFA